MTLQGTRTWLERAVLDAPDRVLFWVVDHAGRHIGHIGLNRFAPDASFCELDNIVRGEPSEAKGIMTAAVEKLLQWQRESLRVPTSYLRVFSDNAHAIAFYNKLGYREIGRVPLRKVPVEGGWSWEEVVADPYRMIPRYFVTMQQGEP
ncbi:MAG: GNAT family N-acetyltransferase [Oxalobacteraceae bacterium]|nr:MAG: GNAT family N-acetyltransferase [Oxalobacteraceae bacterium]